MGESLETIMARFDERQKANNEMTLELLKIVKGDNGEGLTTKLARLEEGQENCPLKPSVKWLTWGFRMVIALIAGGFFWMMRK